MGRGKKFFGCHENKNKNTATKKGVSGDDWDFCWTSKRLRSFFLFQRTGLPRFSTCSCVR